MIKRDIQNHQNFSDILRADTYFDMISPYGYGGFIFEGPYTDNIDTCYKEYCDNNNIISEFIRFNLFSDYYKYYKGNISSPLNNIVRNLEITEDELLMDFEHKVRKNIKRATANNLEVILDEKLGNFDDFVGIYFDTMKRNNAKEEFYFNKSFFEEINSMKDNYKYFHVLKDGKVISTELILLGKEAIYSFLGGTLEGYFDLRPNDFLKYKIMIWGIKQGFKNFILGGGYGSDDGIYKYKKSFSPKGIQPFYIGKRIFNQTIYSELCSFRNLESSENSFFPLYRS